MSSIGVVNPALKTLPDLLPAAAPPAAGEDAPHGALPPGASSAEPSWRAPDPHGPLVARTRKHAPRQRPAEPVTDPVRSDGKLFGLGAEKSNVKAVTYGPFAPDAEGCYLPDAAQARRDFQQL